MKAQPGLIDFIREIAHGRTTRQIQDEIRMSFGIDVSIRTIEGYKTYYNIRSFEGKRAYAVKEYPDEIRQFIIDNCYHISYEQMAKMVNERFKTEYTASMMARFYQHNDLHSMLGGKHSDGLVNPLIGRRFKRKTNTGFQKGRQPWKKSPVGTIRTQKNGIVYKKTADPNTWKPLYRALWEEANGPVPDGYIIMFLDGNSRNADLSNMILVEKRLAHYHVLNGIKTGDAGLTKTSIQLSKLKLAISDKKKTMNRAEENDHECTVQGMPEENA